MQARLNIFVSDLGEERRRSVNRKGVKCADDTKLAGITNTEVDQKIILHDSDEW